MCPYRLDTFYKLTNSQSPILIISHPYMCIFISLLFITRVAERKLR